MCPVEKIAMRRSADRKTGTGSEVTLSFGGMRCRPTRENIGKGGPDYK